MSTTATMATVTGHDCNFCSHNRVCRIKFQVKDAIEMNKGLHLTISCDEYVPMMNPPEEPDEESVEAPTVRKVARKKVVRRKAK